MKNKVKKHTGSKVLFIAFTLTLILLVLSITTFGQTKQEQIAKYETQIEELEESIAQHEATIEATTAKKERKVLQKEIAEYNKEIAEYNKKIAKLNKNKFLDNDINTDDTTEIRFGDKKIMIIGEKGNLEEGIERIELSLEELQDGIIVFKSKKSSHEKEIERLNDSINKANKQLETASTDDAKDLLLTQIDEYEEQIEEHEEIIESFDDGIVDIEDDLSDLEDDLNDLAEELADLEDELGDSFDYDFDYDIGNSKRRKRKFRGHWAGLEFGASNFLNNNYELKLPTDGEFMELNANKSWQLGVNFFQYSIPFTRYIGLTTGTGFEWTYYNLRQNIDFATTNGVISPVEVSDKNYKKNVFRTTYFSIPLILEFQIPVSRKDRRINIGIGVIGSVKVNSKFKKVFYENGDKMKQKINDDYDYYASPYKYSVTARVGYRSLQLYANYSLVSLFEPNAGPELYPITVGLHF